MPTGAGQRGRRKGAVEDESPAHGAATRANGRCGHARLSWRFIVLCVRRRHASATSCAHAARREPQRCHIHGAQRSAVRSCLARGRGCHRLDLLRKRLEARQRIAAHLAPRQGASARRQRKRQVQAQSASTCGFADSTAATRAASACTSASLADMAAGGALAVRRCHHSAPAQQPLGNAALGKEEGLGSPCDARPAPGRMPTLRLRGSAPGAAGNGWQRLATAETAHAELGSWREPAHRTLLVLGAGARGAAAHFTPSHVCATGDGSARMPGARRLAALTSLDIYFRRR